MLRAWPAIVAIVTALGLGCGRPPPPTLAPPATAPLLPPLELPQLDGTPWQSDQHRGRVLVIDVWASYCAPCRKAFPHLNALAERGDVDVVGLSVDETAAAAQAFLHTTHAGFTIVLDFEQRIQASSLAVSTLPTLLVIDGAGRVRWRRDESVEADYRALPAVVDQLVAEAAATPRVTSRRAAGRQSSSNGGITRPSRSVKP